LAETLHSDLCIVDPPSSMKIGLKWREM